MICIPLQNLEPVPRLLGQLQASDTTYCAKTKYPHTCYNAGVRHLSEPAHASTVFPSSPLIGGEDPQGVPGRAVPGPLVKCRCSCPRRGWIWVPPHVVRRLRYHEEEAGQAARRDDERSSGKRARGTISAMRANAIRTRASGFTSLEGAAGHLHRVQSTRGARYRDVQIQVV